MAGAPAIRTAPAVLWGSNDDTRLLLRGLLRLYRFPVIYEARSLEDLEQLPTASEPRLLLRDLEAKGGDWSGELASALRLHTELRAVVILPPGLPAAEAEALRAGAKAVLPRPFAIREFLRVVSQVVG